MVVYESPGEQPVPPRRRACLQARTDDTTRSGQTWYASCVVAMVFGLLARSVTFVLLRARHGFVEERPHFPQPAASDSNPESSGAQFARTRQ